jgi:putative sigma-54 modulation protein
MGLAGGSVSVQVNISTRHGHLSDKTREKIVQKAERLTRVFERVTSISVTVDLDDQETPRVDINVSAEHKRDFVASHQSSSLMGSVDVVLQKVEHQLRKYKEKIQQRHRDPGLRRQETTPDSESEAI